LSQIIVALAFGAGVEAAAVPGRAACLILQRNQKPVSGLCAGRQRFASSLALGREELMYLSGESLLIILLVGLIAGWLAGEIVAGGGFGLVGDIAIGIVGAFIGSWLLPHLGLRIGGGLVSMIIVATIGAVVLLLLLGLFRGGGWGWGYRRRW